MAFKISACVIVKNEERNLPRWLKCNGSLADEIIVVDTGSTDNTVKIAEEAGAKLFYFKWINDFAAAKNYAIEQATGDWIMFLDADESFTQETQKKLHKELERFDKDKSVAALLCRLLDVNEDDDYKIVNTFLLPRIFRRSPYIRYKGAIHEQLENSRGNKRMVFASEVEIMHTGYSSSIVRSKVDRNLPMMLEEFDKAKTDKEKRRLYPYLMDAYNTLQDHEKVLYYGQKCIDNNLRMLAAPAHFYEVITMSMYHAGKPAEEIMAKLDEAEEKFPEEPFLHFVRGMVCEREGDHIASEKSILKGLELRKILMEKMAKGVGAPDTSRGFLPYAYERLGIIYALKNEKQKAADNFYMALKQHKYQRGALRGLCRIMAGNDDVELIELLNTIYDRELDGRFILDALKGAGSQGLMAYYSKGVKGTELAYAYMAGKKYNSAAVKLGQKYKALSQLGVLSAYNMNEFPQDGYLATLLSKKYRDSLVEGKKEDSNILKRLKDYRIRCELDQIRFPADKMPLVSIMIPTYNRPEFFERTLMSAINQSYPNVEILVNDNSTNDDTQALMEKYAGVVNLQYFRNKEARTKAENFAPFETQTKGQYLQWCMDDDLLAADKLTKMVPILRDNPAVTIVSSIRGIVDENDEPIKRDSMNNIPIPEGQEYGYFYGEDMAGQMLLFTQNLIGEPSAVLFRRNDLIHHYWQAEAKGYKTISDVAMWCELLEKGHCLIFKQPLSFYRRHGSQEGQRPEIILLSRLEWMQLITSYHEQGKYITSQESYKRALMVLYNEYQSSFKNNEYLRQADNFMPYSEAMELITRLV